MQGEHYCGEHQGNTSHYHKNNCVLCKLEDKVKQLKKALREHNILFEKIDEAMADPERIARDKSIVGGFVSTLDLTETAEEIVERTIFRLRIITPMVAPTLYTPPAPLNLGSSIERFQILGRGTVFNILCPDATISAGDVVLVDGELWEIVAIESMGEVKPGKGIGLVVKKPKQED